MDTQTQHLPQDLITGILLRLPVKSLVRFKAVCKSWRSLISAPHFARSHFELATPRLVFDTGFGIQTMDLDGSLHTNPISEAINVDFLPTRSHTQIVGSCRGFLLLESKETLCLWNPSTHVHKRIPSFPLYTETYLCGFGYDSLEDDYLVVIVSFHPRSSHVQFFSLRANKWKCEGTHFYRWNYNSRPIPGLLFNEAIHWLDPDSSDAIIVFDLMEKRLLEIPVPDDVAENLLSCGLWVYGRFLSLWDVECDPNTLEIWVMEKYKVQSSWTKTLVLSMGDIYYVSPLYSTKNGDIVMDSVGGLVKYTDKGEQLEERGLEHSPEYSVPMYTESIFSLPGVSEQSLVR